MWASFLTSFSQHPFQRCPLCLCALPHPQAAHPLTGVQGSALGGVPGPRKYGEMRVFLHVCILLEREVTLS